MSWHYLQAQEAVSSDRLPLDTELFAQSKSTPSVGKSSSRGSAKDIFQGSLFGTTFALSPDFPGAGSSTLSLADFLARISRPQDVERDWKARRAGFGCIWLVSSPKSNRGKSSSRTAPCCEPVALSPSCRTLPPSGMMRLGVCSRLKMLEPRTSEEECSFLLPTITTRIGRRQKGRVISDGTRERRLTAEEYLEKLLPTPTALDTLTGGPWIAFREWMMGWPIGWSGLQPLATDRFREWCDWHMPRSQESWDSND